MKARKSLQSGGPQTAQALHELAGEISKVMGNSSEMSTAVPGLTLYQNTVPTASNPCTYVPSLLLIPQGKKCVDLGKQNYMFGESTFLLTSIELPIISRVCAASVEKPYLAFFLKLDMGTRMRISARASTAHAANQCHAKARSPRTCICSKQGTVYQQAD